MLFLLMVEATRRLIVLTESDMYALCIDEQTKGRVPSEIEFARAAIPDALRARLKEARATASSEVTPR